MSHARHALGTVGLLLCACSAAPVSKDCSDEAYLKTAAQCAALVGTCLQAGGLAVECEMVCDEMADEWERRCSQ